MKQTISVGEGGRLRLTMPVAGGATAEEPMVVQFECSFEDIPLCTVLAAVETKQFADWVCALDRERMTIRSITFQSVDMFGPKKVGFIKFKAEIQDRYGRNIPGIVFMRGGSVGILPVFVCNGKKYAVLTVQPRVPTGKFDFMEIPAGMLDGNGNFAGVAAKELDEELGLTICETDLVDLTALAGHTGGVFLSPGGSDETIRLFALTREVSEDELNGMNGRLTGVQEEGEQITLRIVPLEDTWKVNDAKTIVAVTLYQKFCRA